MGALGDLEKSVAKLYWLAIFGNDGSHSARGFRLDLVHDLHGFNDADSLTFTDGITDFDESGSIW